MTTALYRQGTQQQRPESPTVTLTWHASTYNVHNLHRRYIENIPLVEFMYFAFTRMRGENDRRRFRSLLLCPLSVERYQFLLFVEKKIYSIYDLRQNIGYRDFTQNGNLQWDLNAICPSICPLKLLQNNQSTTQRISDHLHTLVRHAKRLPVTSFGLTRCCEQTERLSEARDKLVWNCGSAIESALLFILDWTRWSTTDTDINVFSPEIPKLLNIISVESGVGQITALHA